MKKYLVMLFALVLVVSFASVSMAKGKAKAKEAAKKEGCEPKVKATAEKVANAVVKSVDAAKGEMVVTADGKDMTIMISKEQAAKVKAGDKVNVDYDRTEKACTATKITKARGAKVPVGC